MKSRLLPKKVKKILLIHPPGNRVIRPNGERGLKAAVQPLGLAYLAAVLRERKYEVAILDCIAEGYDEPEIEIEPNIFLYGLSDEKIAMAISDFRPDVVGISCPQTARQLEANRVAFISKEVFPNVPVVMGGASPTVLKEEIFWSGNVDFIIQAEGEYRFCDFLGALQGMPGDFSKVDGLIYRDEDSIIVNAVKKVICDIDRIPMPAYDLLPMEKYYSYDKNPSVTTSAANTSIMLSSRGCPKVCYYCPVHNVFGPSRPSYRLRSIENIMKEIELLLEKYNVGEIQFEDANFNASVKRTIDISTEIANRFPGLRWCTPHGNQISTLKDRVLDAMWAAGCYSLYLAIESGNQEFLDSHKNFVRLNRVKHLLRKARSLGFELNLFMMIGFPEETRDDIEKTVCFAKELEIDNVHFFIATPLPGTEMYALCKEEGLLLQDRSWRYFRYSVGVIRTEHFDPSYLQNIRREAWLSIRQKIENQKGSLNISEMEQKIYG